MWTMLVMAYLTQFKYLVSGKIGNFSCITFQLPPSTNTMLRKGKSKTSVYA